MSWATATLTSGPGDEGAGGRVDGATRDTGDGSAAFPTVTVRASVVPAEESGAAKRSNK